MQKGRGSRRHGKQHRAKEDTNWAETVDLPFDLVASLAIYSLLTESHASSNSSSAAEEQKSLRDTISEMRVVLVV
jgi:hypothetical protein